ncbi:MAG: FAD-dependent oxidoreductase [Verrucomicrobiales bacterium]
MNINTAGDRVVVIGGGVIGLCVAYYALRSGKQVVVIEREVQGGENCSGKNAGMVVPSHFVPLAAPGMIALGLRWMFNPESPFAFSLRPGLALMRWAYLFWRHANRSHVEACRGLLCELNLKSRELFVELSAEFDYGLVKRGLLMLCEKQQTLESEARHAESARELGLDVEVCSTRRLTEIDPGIEMAVTGGIWFKQDCHMDPEAFTSGLRAKIIAMGGKIRYGAGVEGFIREEGRVKAVQASARLAGSARSEEIEADQVVIAGGVWSTDLARELRLKLPMAAGKGYSMTLSEPAQLPRICSILAEARVAVTPIGDVLRFAGTMEIGGRNLLINERRIKGICKSVSRCFPQFREQQFDGVERWAGLRPCSPDGLPYLGPAGPGAENVFIATGHAMMGLSLAPVTGYLMAQLLSGNFPDMDIGKLTPARF